MKWNLGDTSYVKTENVMESQVSISSNLISQQRTCQLVDGHGKATAF